MHVRSYQIFADSTSLHFSEAGKGEPLLISPVTWGVDGHRWSALEELANNFTLIRLDPRGTGKSGDVKEKSDYGIPTLLNDIEAVRKHLRIEQWNILGQSAGGWTALEYTLAHSSNVKKLIVVCSAPTGKFQKGTFRDSAHPLFPQYDALSKEIRSLPHDERVKAFNRTIYQYDVQTDEARKKIDEIFSQAEFNAKRNQYFISTEVQRYDVTEKLQTISVPSLIIGGKYDVHVSPQWSVMMAEKIPNATLVMMEHSGHFPWLDEPKEFFDVITKFISH